LSVCCGHIAGQNCALQIFELQLRVLKAMSLDGNAPPSARISRPLHTAVCCGHIDVTTYWQPLARLKKPALQGEINLMQQEFFLCHCDFVVHRE
jgi:hypothetical protein